MYKVTNYLEELKPTSRRVEAIEYALKTFKLSEDARKELEDHVESNLALEMIKEKYPLRPSKRLDEREEDLLTDIQALEFEEEEIHQELEFLRKERDEIIKRRVPIQEAQEELLKEKTKKKKPATTRKKKTEQVPSNATANPESIPAETTGDVPATDVSSV